MRGTKVCYEYEVDSVFLSLVQILSKLSIDRKQKKNIAEIMNAFVLLALMCLANDVRGEGEYLSLSYL